MSVIDEVRFWSIVINESRQTVICSPEMESRCKGFVDVRGLGGIIAVKPSPYCPDDRLFVMDEQAQQAWLNEKVQQPIRPRP